MAILLKVTGAFTVPGWTTIILVTSFLGGVQLIVLGVVGEYVGRTYIETKRRPLYIVNHSMGLADTLTSPQRARSRQSNDLTKAEPQRRNE